MAIMSQDRQALAEERIADALEKIVTMMEADRKPSVELLPAVVKPSKAKSD